MEATGRVYLAPTCGSSWGKLEGVLSSVAGLDTRVFIVVSSHHHPAGDLVLPLVTQLGTAWMAGLVPDVGSNPGGMRELRPSERSDLRLASGNRQMALCLGRTEVPDMLLTALVLAAALAPQEAPPPAPAEVAPVEETAATPAAESFPAVTAADAPAPAPVPALAQASIDAGLAAYRRRRFAEAATEFRKAINADPSSAAAHYYLGYAIYKQAEPRRRNAAGKREALEEFSRAFALDPAFRPAWR